MAIRIIMIIIMIMATMMAMMIMMAMTVCENVFKARPHEVGGPQAFSVVVVRYRSDCNPDTVCSAHSSYMSSRSNGPRFKPRRGQISSKRKHL